MNGRISIDPETEAIRIKEEESRRAIEVQDLKNVLSSPSGLRFVQRLIGEGKPLARGMFGNSKDYYNGGLRDFSLGVLHDVIENAPQYLTRLMRKPKELRDLEAQE